MDTYVSIRKSGKFYIAKGREFPVNTQGKTRQEAIQNFVEALYLFGTDPDARERFPKLKQLFVMHGSEPETFPGLVINFNFGQGTNVSYGSFAQYLGSGISPNSC